MSRNSDELREHDEAAQDQAARRLARRCAPTAAAAPETDRCRASTASARRRRGCRPRTCTAARRSSDRSNTWNLPAARAGVDDRRPAAGDPRRAARTRRRRRRRCRRTSARRRSRSPPTRRRAPCRRSSPRRARSPPSVTGTPVTTAITSAVANRRMPSASERVSRKMTADSVLHARPNRRCSSSYDVNEVAAEIGRNEQHADDARGR